MKKIPSRNGFTIAELVITICVIAILASILIPTFTYFTQQSDLSADHMLTDSMNNALRTAQSMDAPLPQKEALAVLAYQGYDDFQPKTAGYSFYWIPEENRVVLCDTQSNAAVYPESYAGATIAPAWVNLNPTAE